MFKVHMENISFCLFFVTFPDRYRKSFENVGRVNFELKKVSTSKFKFSLFLLANIRITALKIK